MKRWFNTTTKILTWLIVINGEIQVYMSYILAFRGNMEALEGLSSTIISQIMAPLILLFLKTLIENVFEKNQIFKKEKSIEEGGNL